MSEWISDYTPSIEGMRGTYRETWFYAPHTNKEKEKDAEFDRFLKLVYQVERERIIKLLEEYEVIGVDSKTRLMLNEDALIALIKGEPTECECDPCGNENCDCRGKRCDFCKAQDV